MHPNPELPMSTRPSVPHEGQLFMQRLGGRTTVAAAALPDSHVAPAADSDLQDLDQRVRNVGEW